MAKWYSAGISNPSRDEGMGSNPGAVQKKKKIAGSHNLRVMTWVWPGSLRVSEVQGRNTCYKECFFSEGSLLSSSPMSFYLQIFKKLHSDIQFNAIVQFSFISWVRWIYKDCWLQLEFLKIWDFHWYNMPASTAQRSFFFYFWNELNLNS